MPALGARTRRDPFTGGIVDNVLAIARLTRLGIEALENVLEKCLVMIDVAARLAVDLPEDAGLTDREQRALAFDIDDDALEDLIEIE